MHIVLTDYNATMDTTYRIYRSYFPINEDNLPPVLVELPQGTKFWDDPTVEFQRVVYYRVGVVHNGNEVVGPQYCSQQRYYTGPQIDPTRPDVVIRGNGEVGRYGDMLPDAVVPQSEIAAFLGDAATVISPQPEGLFYEKCELFEKILFLPSVPNFVTSYKDMYMAGCAFATDELSTITPEMQTVIGPAIPQGKILLSGGNAFRVRLMTRNEFLTCYSLLFPESIWGSQSDVVLSRCNYFDGPIITTGEEKGLDVFHSALFGGPAYTSWEGKVPTPIVLELINRNEVAQAEPDANNFGPVEGAKESFYSNSIIMNGRFHVMGGIEYKAGDANYSAITDHWSVNLEGGDLQWHAPMPVGSAYAATWTDGTTIYVWGGCTGWTSPYTPTGFTEAYQMWSDPNNDGVGVWTQITANQPSKFGASATIITDSKIGIKRVEIIGTDLKSRPRNFRYWGPVENPDGLFSTEQQTIGGTQRIGSIYCQYRDRILGYGGGDDVRSYTNRYGWTKGDSVADAYWYYGETARKNGYGQTSNGGVGLSWRDGLFIVPPGRFNSFSGIFQYIPDEFRWAFIKIPLAVSGDDFFPDGSAMATHDNIVMAYTGSRGPWYKAELKRLVLRDTLDEPLIPIMSVDIFDTKPFAFYVSAQMRS